MSRKQVSPNRETPEHPAEGRGPSLERRAFPRRHVALAETWDAGKVRLGGGFSYFDKSCAPDNLKRRVKQAKDR